MTPLAVTPSPGIERWPDSKLDAMREICDPAADDAVAQLFATGQVQAVNQMMRDLVANDGIPTENLPPVIQSYLAESGRMPDWADPEKIRTGEQLFWRYGPHVISTLFCYSLPFCYVARKGVQVLWLTSRLYTNPTRRIIETAQMVFDVMHPGGIAPQGTGVRSAQKVRLMHAGVRHQVRAYSGWKAEFNQPINQEDLAGTLLAFSWVVIDGLRKLGFHPTDAEAEAYLHCWKVVGHILGVREDMMARDISDAELLARRIQERQCAACQEGRDMTKALLDMLKYVIPGDAFDHIPALLLRFQLGDKYADLLDVERIDGAKALFQPLRILNAIGDTIGHLDNDLAHVSAVFSRHLIEGILMAGRGGNRVPFNIPTELRQTWGINWTAA